jgi:hypothetical protein
VPLPLVTRTLELVSTEQSRVDVTEKRVKTLAVEPAVARMS